MSDLPGGTEGEQGGPPAARAREGTLHKLKRALHTREVPVPRLEGYPLAKARKILDLTGLGQERLRVKLVHSEEARGRVVRQHPRAGDKVDRAGEQPIEVQVADQSIVSYLPHIYQRTDLTGRNFVRDLLWVFQHVHFQSEEKLLHLERYFDPHEAPAGFLEYLASWVALDLEPGWPEHKKRSLIKKAVELYHLRGTPRGLRIYLRIFTGVDPLIAENAWPHQGFVVGVSCSLGVDTVLTHEVDKRHTFVVHIPLPIDEVDDDTIRRVHRIIEREKPVHTDYYLSFAPPEEQDVETGFTVGVSSTVGVDTWVKGEAPDPADPGAGAGEPDAAAEDGAAEEDERGR